MHAFRRRSFVPQYSGRHFSRSRSCSLCLPLRCQHEREPRRERAIRARLIPRFSPHISKKTLQQAVHQRMFHHPSNEFPRDAMAARNFIQSTLYSMDVCVKQAAHFYPGIVRRPDFRLCPSHSESLLNPLLAMNLPRKCGRTAAGIACGRVTQATGRGARFLPVCQPISRKNLYAAPEGGISPSGHFTTQPASSAA